MGECTRLLDLKKLVMFLTLNHTSSISCVFKCRCHYYSGIVRPTDQEMIGIEKSVCYGSEEERTTWESTRVSWKTEQVG